MADKTFAFGRNWQSYVARYLDPGRVKEAARSLVGFMGLPSLEGKTFIDVGCGSGLFSLCAHQLGAARVVSFDVDESSVACCRYLREQEGSPGNWEVLTGSILDDDLVARIGTFDIVYSWGVLHHTGDMWRAIGNAARLVADGGLFWIAIYNKADGFAFYPDGRVGPSGLWALEKRVYNSLPGFLQNVVDYSLMSVMVLIYLLTLQNPVRKIKGHRELRGMSWRIDIKDWLGGYPYEYATVAEIFAFLHGRGFGLENLKCNNGLLNNEFLFSASTAGRGESREGPAKGGPESLEA